MRVEHKEARQEKPVSCDDCGTETEELKRIYDYITGHDVTWLCKYCSHSFLRKSEISLSRTLGAMFNVLEKELKNGRQ